MKKHNIGIRMKDCHFEVNREKRKVICIIDGVSDSLYRFLGMHNFYFLDKNTTERLWLPNRFVGIATCAENDKWDEDLGKRIAFIKAKRKYGNSFFKRANYFIRKYDNYVDKLADRINEYGARLTTNMEKEQDIVNRTIHDEAT